MSDKKTGANPVVFLVGAGPGDPGLITVKGTETLARADVVIYDALVNNSLLEIAPSAAELIFAGKKKGSRILEQEEINRLLVEKARRGKTVVRLKGGDPFVFGRGGEEAEALVSAGIPVEIVPGVSSVYSVPAYSGVALTHRDFNSSFAVVTGHENPREKSSKLNWKAISEMETAVFLMSLNNIEEIAEKLIKMKKSPKTPVMAVARGTTGGQKTVAGTLGNIVQKIDKEAISPPAVIMVGGAIEKRKVLSWFEKKPLFGKKIIVTRPAGQSADFIKILQQNGAETINFPTIKIVRPSSWKETDRIIKKIKSCDFLTFTSANGVDFFFSRLRVKGFDSRAIANSQTVAIGSKTAAALESYGIKADIIPKKYTAEGTLAEIKKRKIKGKTFFIPRAEKAPETLPDGLMKMGAKVKTANCYRTTLPKYGREEIEFIKQKIIKGKIDMAVFTSSSSAVNFFEIFKKSPEILRELKTACIGPVTAQTVEEAGFKPAVIAKKHTAEKLFEEIKNFFAKQE